MTCFVYHAHLVSESELSDDLFNDIDLSRHDVLCLTTAYLVLCLQ